MRDLNEIQAMSKDLLKHKAQKVQLQFSIEMKDRIDVLDLDKLSTYDQDDLLRLVFAARETLLEQESESRFLRGVLGLTFAKKFVRLGGFLIGLRAAITYLLLLVIH